MDTYRAPRQGFDRIRTPLQWAWENRQTIWDGRGDFTHSWKVASQHVRKWQRSQRQFAPAVLFLAFFILMEILQYVMQNRILAPPYAWEIAHKFYAVIDYITAIDLILLVALIVYVATKDLTLYLPASIALMISIINIPMSHFTHYGWRLVAWTANLIPIARPDYFVLSLNQWQHPVDILMGVVGILGLAGSLLNTLRIVYDMTWFPDSYERRQVWRDYQDRSLNVGRIIWEAFKDFVRGSRGQGEVKGVVEDEDIFDSSLPSKTKKTRPSRNERRAKRKAERDARKKTRKKNR